MAEILIGSNKKMFLQSGVLDFFSIDRIQEVLVSKGFHLTRNSLQHGFSLGIRKYATNTVQFLASEVYDG